MRKFVYLSALCTIPSFMICCMPSKSSQSDVTQKLKTSSIVIDSIHPLIDGKQAPACHFNLDVEYAEQGQEGAETLNGFIVSACINEMYDGMSLQEATSKCCESYVNDYVKEMQSASENYSQEDADAAATWMSYEHIFKGNIVYKYDNIVSYQTLCMDYAGGAHGMTTRNNFVFDLKDAQRVYLADLFHEAGVPAVSQMAREQLMQDLGCATLQEVAQSTCIFAPEEMDVTDNFIVDESGVTWTYNPYEIACYAQGEISVTLSWEKVLPMLKNDSPIMDLAKSLCKGAVASSEISQD